MPFFFEPFPTVEYDIKKNGKTQILTNLTLRFKVQAALKDRTAVFYDYTVKEGERPDVIAHKYYGDASLDWIILLSNDIINPHFDWPLDFLSFQRFLRKKYGSVQTAKDTVHHYEQIIQTQSVLFDGTIIPEKTLWVDQDTYNSLAAADRKSISSYTHEDNLNEAKREIKILDKKYVTSLVNEVENIFE
jgi:hypothetical protein